MTVSVSDAIPVIFIILISVLGSLCLFTYPIILLGMRIQRKKDPRDRESVRKEKAKARKAREERDELFSNVLFLDNVTAEYRNQLDKFIRRTGGKE